jgi:hypothetical protein
MCDEAWTEQKKEVKIRIHYGCGGKVIPGGRILYFFHCMRCHQATDYVTFLVPIEEVIASPVVMMVFQPYALQN